MELQILVSIICGIAGFLISYLTFVKLRHKDIKHDASELAIITTKLDNIGQGVDNIRVEMRTQEVRVSELTERLTRVEESSKQAHKRLDRMKGEDKK